MKQFYLLLRNQLKTLLVKSLIPFSLFLSVTHPIFAKPSYQVICYAFQTTEAPANSVQDTGQGAAINWTTSVPWNDLTMVADAFFQPNTNDTFTNQGAKTTVLINAAHAQSDRCIVSLGGAGQDGAFGTLCSSAANRTAFASAVTALVMQYGYDGVDIDWETTGAASQANATAMMQALYTAIKALPASSVDGKARTLSLTTAPYLSAVYNMTTLGSCTDWCFFMGYDWYDGSNANGPLNGDNPSVVSGIQSMTNGSQWSYPISKMVLGCPLYCNDYNAGYEIDSLSILHLGTPGAYNASFAEQAYKAPSGDTVYVDTAQSYCDKMNWALGSGLMGIGMWDMAQALPYTDSAVTGIWNVIGGNASCLTVVGPTATPTSTKTSTLTPSSTPTKTPALPTATPTSTPTATRTGTPTSTATSTLSATFTPSRTATSTVTFTSTNTLTATLSSTATRTPVPPTATPTSSGTFTSTPSSTPSVTPSATGTSSPTRTSTASPTNTAVASTATSAASKTPSSTPSSTPSHTVTWTVTSTATLTGTSTPSPTGTLVATSTPTLTQTASNTVTSTATRTPSETPTQTALSTATETLTSTSVSTATSTPSGTPSATPSATASKTGTAPPSFTPSATASSTGSASPTVTGTASSTPTRTLTLTPTSTDSSTPTLTPSATASATRTSTPTNTPTATPSFTPSFTLTATPSFTPSSTATSSRTPTTTVTSTVTPVGQGTPVVYPNPWNGEGTLKLSVTLGAPGEVKVKVFTTAFRKVLEQDFLQEPAGTDELALNMPRLANGLYYLVVESAGKRWIVKLMVLG